MNLQLKPNERLDDLLVSGRKIIQNETEFCFSLDAVLLAGFAKAKKSFHMLDLGTGTGVIPLLMANKVRRIDAVEISSVMAELAQRNMEINGLAGKITVKEGNYCNIRELYTAEFADLVVANPPYRPVAQGQTNALTGVARARHEVAATLADVISAARYALKFHGRFAMVHLPERLGEILVTMHENNIEAKRLCFVQPKADKAPNMMLVEGIAGGKAGGLKVLPPLIVHKDDGTYTGELLKYYE